MNPRQKQLIQTAKLAYRQNPTYEKLLWDLATELEEVLQLLEKIEKNETAGA